MEPKLVFNVENQKVIRMDSFHPVQDSRNYLYAEFRFMTSDWNEHRTKTAVFKGAEAISVVLSDDGRCLVPWEVLRKDSFTVSVFAGDLITTNKSVVKVYRSGYESGRDVKDPTPSVYEQIIESLDETKAYAAEQAKVAVNAADDAKASRQYAESAKTAAESAANRAESEAEDVKTSAAYALAEIKEKKTDAIGEIESARDTGVQAVNTAKVSAQKEIVGQIAGIHEAGAKNLTAVNAAGDEWLSDINAAGKSQTDSITTAGAAQVSAVNTAGENQLSAIETASTAAQTDIGTAKEDAVSAVQAEGETQVENIRQSAADYESLAIKETARGESILIEDSAKWPLKEMKLFGKSTQDGTPSPENPVPIVSAGDSGEIEVGVYGGNLFDIHLFDGKSNSLVKVDVSSDGTVTLTNLIDKSGATIVSVPLNLLPGENYIYSIEYDKTKGLSNIDVVENGVRTRVITHDTTFIAKVGAEYQLKIYSGVGTSAPVSTGDSVVYKNIRLNMGNKLLPYEPYTKQSLTYPTPNGLPGIPVSSGGNYTDESGQQWVCDEVDFERGVYIKRLGNWKYSNESVVKQEYFGTRFRIDAKLKNVKNGNKNGLSNIFVYSISPVTTNTDDNTICAYSNGGIYVRCDKCETENDFAELALKGQLEVLYMLETPIEINMSQQELSAYAALHTNYPTTTVMNDAGAGMEVEYVADTQHYIEKLLTATQQRISALEANAIGG